MKRGNYFNLRAYQLRHILMSLALSLVVLLFVDMLAGKKVQHTGIIVEKVHRPRTDYQMVHTTWDEKGNPTTYFTTETDPEQWILYVEAVSGSVFHVNAQPLQFYTHQVGDPIPYITVYGLWTHIAWTRHATNQPIHTHETKNTQDARKTSSY